MSEDRGVIENRVETVTWAIMKMMMTALMMMRITWLTSWPQPRPSSECFQASRILASNGKMNTIYIILMGPRSHLCWPFVIVWRENDWCT